jgi:hypothetical protein
LYKVFSNIIYKRLLPYTEDIIGNYKYGFRQGKSTTDAIHALRQILEKTREYNITTHHLFIDFKVAYDSTKRDKLISAMKEFKIPKKLVHLTEAILRRVACSVKIYNDVYESFTTQRGVRQGDALACLLFNLALEKVIQNAGIEKRGTIYHKSIQFLAYGDDVNLIGRTIRDLKGFYKARV